MQTAREPRVTLGASRQHEATSYGSVSGSSVEVDGRTLHRPGGAIVGHHVPFRFHVKASRKRRPFSSMCSRIGTSSGSSCSLRTPHGPVGAEQPRSVALPLLRRRPPSEPAPAVNEVGSTGWPADTGADFAVPAAAADAEAIRADATAAAEQCGTPRRRRRLQCSGVVARIRRRRRASRAGIGHAQGCAAGEPRDIRWIASGNSQQDHVIAIVLCCPLLHRGSMYRIVHLRHGESPGAARRFALDGR